MNRRTTFAVRQVSESQSITPAFGSAPGNQATADHGTPIASMQAGAHPDRTCRESRITADERVCVVRRADAWGGADPMARGASIGAGPDTDSPLALLRRMGD